MFEESSHYCPKTLQTVKPQLINLIILSLFLFYDKEFNNICPLDRSSIFYLNISLC